MPRKTDDIIKGFIGDIGTLIDARNKTLEINLKAHVDSTIKASEERIRKDMATKKDLMATKEDLKKIEDKMATKEDLKKIEDKMATKEDLKLLSYKIDKTMELQHQLDELKERVKTLEKNTRIHN